MEKRYPRTIHKKLKIFSCYAEILGVLWVLNE